MIITLGVLYAVGACISLGIRKAYQAFTYEAPIENNDQKKINIQEIVNKYQISMTQLHYKMRACSICNSPTLTDDKMYIRCSYFCWQHKPEYNKLLEWYETKMLGLNLSTQPLYKIITIEDVAFMLAWGLALPIAIFKESGILLGLIARNRILRTEHAILRDSNELMKESEEFKKYLESANTELDNFIQRRT